RTRLAATATADDERPATWVARRSYGQWRSALACDDLLGCRGQHGVQVTHDAEVDQLEERCLFVLVDRDDGLRGLHAGTVLDGTGDARRHVELGRDSLAGLTDLE